MTGDMFWFEVIGETCGIGFGFCGIDGDRFWLGDGGTMTGFPPCSGVNDCNDCNCC